MVLIIVGILATIAIPRYGRTIERSRQAEATSILGAMRGAQLRFTAENNGAFATVLADLDIDLPDNNNDATTGDGRFFDYDIPPLGTDNDLGRATRNGVQKTGGSTDYELIIEEDGDIRCASTDCAGGP